MDDVLAMTPEERRRELAAAGFDLAATRRKGRRAPRGRAGRRRAPWCRSGAEDPARRDAPGGRPRDRGRGHDPGAPRPERRSGPSGHAAPSASDEPTRGRGGKRRSCGSRRPQRATRRRSRSVSTASTRRGTSIRQGTRRPRRRRSGNGSRRWSRRGARRGPETSRGGLEGGVTMPKTSLRTLHQAATSLRRARGGIHRIGPPRFSLSCGRAPPGDRAWGARARELRAG